jgi:hypothetical protein
MVACSGELKLINLFIYLECFQPTLEDHDLGEELVDAPFYRSSFSDTYGLVRPLVLERR